MTALALIDPRDPAAVDRLVANQVAAVDRAAAMIATMDPALAAATAAAVGAGLGLSAELRSLLTIAAHERLQAHGRATAREAADDLWRRRMEDAKAHAREILAAEWEREARRRQVCRDRGFFFLSVMVAWWTTMTQAQAQVFGGALLAVAGLPAGYLRAWCNGKQPATEEEIAHLGHAALADAARLLSEPERATDDDVAVLHALGTAAESAYDAVESMCVEPLPVPVVEEPKPADDTNPEDESEPGAPTAEYPW